MAKTLTPPEVTSGFFFRESDHMYFLDGKPMTGVTTILGVIAKPALIGWAANMAVDYVESHIIEDNLLIYGTDRWAEVMKEARSAHRKKKEQAGTEGTDVHSEIENVIKGAIQANNGIIRLDLKHDNPQVQNFINWAVSKNVKFLESEKKLHSKTHWLAGTTDFTCEIDGKRFVGDLKTSSGIYYEMFMQCSAYRMMLEEMGEQKYDGSIIVRCGKSGDFETKERYDYETDLKGFLGAVALYRAQETY